MKDKGIKQQSLDDGGNPPAVLMRPRPTFRPDRSRSSVFYLLSPIFCLLVASCSVTQLPVPVVDRAPALQKPASKLAETAKLYTVQKGDTLYGIALNHGLAYKDLAEWNNIENPNAIDIGQQLSLSPPPQSAQPSLFSLSEPAPPPAAETPAPRVATEYRGKFDANTDKLKTEPKAFKLPYSEQTLAQLSRPADTSPTLIARADAATERVAKIDIEPQPQTTESNPDERIDWIWPTQGKMLEGFSESSKGIDIAGRTGQAVLASAAGKVVYSGSGLRGYGNLIIIKHNDTYLSAYAHNSKLLMKEGQTVTRGQKIAEMGNTDVSQIKLHFEIRKHGKPVDPLQHLPAMSK
ncbi:MAG: peptidoglycan DD-metalloendopeptidase family protein [Nitrosomonadaceae bacterium]|nr:peptidoglycan DD-metalloendopeptidase family protein [Nitrosomonadaceae bacterium]